MVDFTFFRSRTFLGANAVAFIVSFAMLATFFFIALYMQNILGYSAVEAGVRFLPSTLMIVLIAPLAGRLTDRVGPRPLMVSGLALTTASLFLQTRIDVDTGYGLLLPAFVLMGIGMALVMSPMSTAAMNAVSADKAGVASGILSMSRMVGGTFGVAAIGALFQHLARNDLEQSLSGTGVSAAARERIVENLGSGARRRAGPAGDRGRPQRIHPRPLDRDVARRGHGRCRRRDRVLHDRTEGRAPAGSGHAAGGRPPRHRRRAKPGRPSPVEPGRALAGRRRSPGRDRAAPGTEDP